MKLKLLFLSLIMASSTGCYGYIHARPDVVQVEVETSRAVIVHSPPIVIRHSQRYHRPIVRTVHHHHGSRVVRHSHRNHRRPTARRHHHQRRTQSHHHRRPRRR